MNNVMLESTCSNIRFSLIIPFFFWFHGHKVGHTYTAATVSRIFTIRVHSGLGHLVFSSLGW